MAERPALLCPSCRAQLRTSAADLRCVDCGRRYPVVAGIPDLRLRSDRYIDLEADRAKAERLEAVERPFGDLVRAYWDMTPEVPGPMAERYTANVLAGPARAARYLEGMPLGPGRTLLDVGCGTGGLLVAAARRGASVTGVDIALRWLVIASRHLRDAGVDGLLVAADAGALPFAPGAFDVVTCIDTLEHAEDQRAAVASCLAAGTRCLIVTANRFTIAPEPTTRLWGLGFLPRAWAPAYVQRRRRTRYQFVRPVSVRELRRFARPRTDVSIGPAPLPPPAGASSAARARVENAYERLRRGGRTRRWLGWIAPFLEVRASGPGG